MTDDRFDSSTARAAALERWAREPDPVTATQSARDGFLARFERQIDPDGKLDPADRRARAERLRRAYMIRLARKSRAARAARRA